MLLVFICESATAVIKPEFHYGSFTGIVQELEPWVHEEGAKFVFLKNEEGAQPMLLFLKLLTFGK